MGAAPNWEIMREMAKRFGVEDAYTEGRTYAEWLRWGYEETLKKAKSLADADKFPSLISSGPKASSSIAWATTTALFSRPSARIR